MNFGMSLGVFVSLSNTEVQLQYYISFFPPPLLWQVLVGLRTEWGRRRKSMNIHVLLISSIVTAEQIKEDMNCDIYLTKHFLVT